LVDHEVTVELKNDIQIRGTLKSVDQYLNIKLDDIQVVEELKYPHLVSVGVWRDRAGLKAQLGSLR
jgi:U6 snRNA-associated Sm-like protein LSm2